MRYHLSKLTRSKIVEAFQDVDLCLHTTSTGGRDGSMFGQVLSFKDIETPELKEHNMSYINVKLGVQYDCEWDLDRYGQEAPLISNITLDASCPLAIIGFGERGGNTVRFCDTRDLEIAELALQSILQTRGELFLEDSLAEATVRLVESYKRVTEPSL